MDKKQLQYFLVLCRQEHMSRAAELLGITQPALSKSIASLERELDTKLFDRSSNSIALNDSGREFAVFAQKALEQLENGEARLHQGRYDTKGVIRIICHAFFDCISDCVLTYAKLNPQIRIAVGQSDSAEEKIADYADFVLAPQNDALLLDTGGHKWIPFPLFREGYCVLISPRYREYPPQVTELSMTDLKDDRFVEFLGNSAFYSDILHPLCRSAGFSPRIFCSTDDFAAKLRIVDEGMAICILPECNLRVARKISPDIRAFAIKGANILRTVYLLRHPESQQTEAAADFWEFVRDFYENKPQD